MTQAAPPIPLDIPPGFVLSEAPLAAKGRYTGGFGIRFWRGRAQKRGGFSALTSTPLIGVPRGAGVWNDLTAKQFIGVGTAFKLYAINNADFNPLDITPVLVSATVDNPITTNLTNPTSVQVHIPAHNAAVGQYIDISGANDTGGVPAAVLNGSYPVASIVDSNNVTFTSPIAATAATTGGGTGVKVDVELAPGQVNAQFAFGWGSGPWGGGAWGTARQSSSLVFYPRIWSVQNFGKVGLFCPTGGGIYAWDATSAVGTRAAIVPTAPTINQGIIATSDEIVIALGANFGGAQDPLSWWSCQQGDYTNWDVTAINPNGASSVQARVNNGNRFIAGADLGVHMALAWTDASLYAFQYNGSQFAFDVLLQGTKCGLIGPMAFVIVGMQAFWLGPTRFWMWNGAGVQAVPGQADILDAFLKNLRPYYSTQVVAWYDAQYNEICWAYVDPNNVENNACVVYNLDGGFWYTDQFIVRRTTATNFTDQNTSPLFFGDDGFLYQDNQGLDAAGVKKPWSLSVAPVELGNGSTSMEVDGLAMDMERQVGIMDAEIIATDRTPANELTIDVGQQRVDANGGLMDFRVAGRQAQLTFSGDGLGCDFRMGSVKLLSSTAGGRR